LIALASMPTSAQAANPAPRMLGPAPVVYNWAGKGPVAAAVMAASRRTVMVAPASRINVLRLRSVPQFLTPQYWSRSSGLRR
jgi:hypothetical protein